MCLPMCGQADKPYKTLIIVKLVLRYKRKEIGHGVNENDIAYRLYYYIILYSIPIYLGSYKCKLLQSAQPDFRTCLRYDYQSNVLRILRYRHKITITLTTTILRL